MIEQNAGDPVFIDDTPTGSTAPTGYILIDIDVVCWRADHYLHGNTTIWSCIGTSTLYTLIHSPIHSTAVFQNQSPRFLGLLEGWTNKARVQLLFTCPRIAMDFDAIGGNAEDPFFIGVTFGRLWSAAYMKKMARCSCRARWPETAVSAFSEYIHALQLILGE